MIESNEAAEPDHRTVTIELPPRQRQITPELTGDVMSISVPPMDGVGADEPVYLGMVMVKGQDEPVRVTLYERDGSQVLVRRVDPCDIDPPPVALFDPGPGLGTLTPCRCPSDQASMTSSRN